ncbi:hypothetical protein ACBZ91_10580 [Vibrio natriegens]|uniref:hypothetical protein n=1 Tax=Vibrio natriegens TaxID=691 RepID=UPI0035584820
MAKERKNKGRFAGIPIFVMESEAYVALPPLAKCLLYELVAQYNGRNNGYLSLTRTDLKSRGFNSHTSNSKAIKYLIESGLITQTRCGGVAKGKRVCHLFALNWQPIDEKINKPLSVNLPFTGSFQAWLMGMYGNVKILAR